MSKAYDMVSWQFLEAVMVQMGFDTAWVTWIMRCVSTVSYSFILNRDPSGQILPSRGLRQGDAISPYLFLFCAEVLSRLFMVSEETGKLNGVRVCRGAPSINHLFFSDDSFIFFKAKEHESLELRNTLQLYERVSGQKINYEKSSIAFSKNVRLDKQEFLAGLLGVLRVDKHEKYLGLPMDVIYFKIDAFDFLKEKVEKRLQGWREKMLSAVAMEVLLKSVIQSIPTYVMSCFEIPKQLCRDIHQLMARFWWGDKGEAHKIHWVAWEKLCTSKEEGDYSKFDVIQPVSLGEARLEAPHKPEFLGSQSLQG
ncbi:uncharacterized protein LOC112188962 [Rosa chinensis]|uniref:uncharacterized protein LOC112188962 n=1 Tax=Rosa chinensis TaxID=74649 RepID=UPI000D08C900|nr:uncharacterized protein LOC112188962 [Rosa chinensis]